MPNSRGWLQHDLCVFTCFFMVTGVVHIPPEAVNFIQCVPSDYDCPLHASCVEANNGHYCQCDSGYFNIRERVTLTYPEGECVAFCKTQGSRSPCPCSSGYVMKMNEKGLYICTNKCEDDSDCPLYSVCKENNCYCSTGLCSPKSKGSCTTSIDIDENCTALNPCSNSPPPCPSPMICVPSQESYGCICPAGFQRVFNSKLNSVTCTALNPCSNSPPPCPSPMICVPSQESYGCICPAGFQRVFNSKLNSVTCSVSINTPSSALSSTIGPISQTTSIVEKSETAVYTNQEHLVTQQDPFTSAIMPTTSHSTLQKTTVSPEAKTTQSEKNKCHSQSGADLEKCEKENRKDELCTLLKSNARIQEVSCQTNTKISVQDVALEFTQVLNQTSLTNLSSLDLRKAVTSFLENVEAALLVTFTRDLRNQNISTPELEVEMKASQDICGSGASSLTLGSLGNTMDVPCSLVSRERDGAIFILYKGLESKLNGNVLGALTDSDHEGTAEIISQVVSGAITSPNTENLDHPVTFYLKHLKSLKPSFVFQCVFWNTTQKGWSRDGCYTKPSDNVNSTLCACYHLSTFAVLMAPGEIQVDVGLVLISRIGLTVSLVCLFLFLLTFILCRSLRSAHTSVLMALCGCLFLGQLLVLVGLQQTWNKVLCSVIAGTLQFLFLCAFCWMSLESILLFMTVRNLRAINYMTSQRSHFPYVCVVGFGIPLIVVVITAATRPDGYRNDKNCWLNQSLIWSFLGPVCGFIVVNLILLFLTFGLLKKKLASLNSNVSTLKHTRLLTFKALSQLFILGCTWIIGLFQFGAGSLIISYIFTICNSLQGAYIFLVHCLLNRQVREEYSRCYRRLRSKKSESEAMSGSTIPMTMKSSQASEAPKSDILSSEKNQK